MNVGLYKSWLVRTVQQCTPSGYNHAVCWETGHATICMLGVCLNNSVVQFDHVVGTFGTSTFVVKAPCLMYMLYICDLCGARQQTYLYTDTCIAWHADMVEIRVSQRRMGNQSGPGNVTHIRRRR